MANKNWDSQRHEESKQEYREMRRNTIEGWRRLRKRRKETSQAKGLNRKGCTADKGNKRSRWKGPGKLGECVEKVDGVLREAGD